MRQLILALVIALIAVVFALQNADPVTVKFMFWTLPDMSLALVLVITLVIGIISGLLFMAASALTRNKKLSDQKKRIFDLEKQISSKQ